MKSHFAAAAAMPADLRCRRKNIFAVLVRLGKHCAFSFSVAIQKGAYC